MSLLLSGVVQTGELQFRCRNFGLGAAPPLFPLSSLLEGPMALDCACPMGLRRTSKLAVKVRARELFAARIGACPTRVAHTDGRGSLAIHIADGWLARSIAILRTYSPAALWTLDIGPAAHYVRADLTPEENRPREGKSSERQRQSSCSVVFVACCCYCCLSLLAGLRLLGRDEIL